MYRLCMDCCVVVGLVDHTNASAGAHHAKNIRFSVEQLLLSLTPPHIQHTAGPEAGQENSSGEGAAGQQLGGEHGHVSGEGAAVPRAGGGHAGSAQGPLHQAGGVSGEPV